MPARKKPVTKKKTAARRKAPAKPMKMSAAQFNEELVKSQMKHENMLLKGKKGKAPKLSDRDRIKAMQLAQEETLTKGLKKFKGGVVTPAGLAKAESKRMKAKPAVKAGQKYTAIDGTVKEYVNDRPAIPAHTKKVVKIRPSKKILDKL